MVGGVIDEEEGGLFGKAGVDEGVACMGVSGYEAVAQPDGKVLPSEVVRNDKTEDILTLAFLFIVRKTKSPKQEYQHHGKHGYKQHGCACEKRFVGITGFSHGAKIVTPARENKKNSVFLIHPRRSRAKTPLKVVQKR